MSGSSSIIPVQRRMRRACTLAVDLLDRDVPGLDAGIGFELLAADAPELRGGRAVPGHESVDLLGGGVAPRPGIAEQHAPARAAEVERGGEAGRASSYDDDVE